MTTNLGYVVPGHIVPGTSDNTIQIYTPEGWETHRIQRGVISASPYGPPIRPEPRVGPVPIPKTSLPPTIPAIGQKPKPLEDISRLGIFHALQKMTEALPGDRLWR